MAEQWQLRKGSTAENEGFVGAEGELTYDTTTKAVHIHDGETAGGALIDAVVAYQLPTSENGYKWYRKYASGWVEQGGVLPATSGWGETTITFPIPMKNNCYACVPEGAWSAGTSLGNLVTQKNTATATFYYFSDAGRGYTSWEVKGIAA